VLSVSGDEARCRDKMRVLLEGIGVLPILLYIVSVSINDKSSKIGKRNLVVDSAKFKLTKRRCVFDIEMAYRRSAKKSE
jgi:hypothetical protein